MSWGFQIGKIYCYIPYNLIDFAGYILGKEKS